jgi:plasmid stabilization system protein ParE
VTAFVLTPRATQDVNEIWDYIAADNVEAADRVLDALDRAMIKLTKNPGIGHWRQEIADKRHDSFLVYSYLIVIGMKPSRYKSSEFSTPPAMFRAFLAWLRTSRKPIYTSTCPAVSIRFTTERYCSIALI